MTIRTSFCLLIAVVTLGLHQAHAQQSGSAFSGTSVSSGLFGSRNLGQGISGGGSTFNGTPGNMVEQAQSGAGQTPQGGERFTREGRDPTAFVGADSADTANFFGQSQNFGNSGLEQFLNMAARRDFQNQGNASGSSAAPLRPALSLGFSPPRPQPAVFNARMTGLLSKLPNLDILQPVSVGLSDRTAVLRGRVATQRDRELIAQLLMLEPGVSNVQNELAVGYPTTPPPRPAVSKSAGGVGDTPRPSVTPIAPPIPDEVPWTGDSPAADSSVVDGLPLPPTAPSADE